MYPRLPIYRMDYWWQQRMGNWQQHERLDGDLVETGVQAHGTLHNAGMNATCPAQPPRCSCQMQWRAGCDNPVGALALCEP
mmetsp:Transcript_24307/g.55326  ORF Transcript_24307/g.55326 Transcript_24307/m.55326 type:complete len:81 (+) Transcript_24307:389-631(+)